MLTRTVMAAISGVEAGTPNNTLRYLFDLIAHYVVGQETVPVPNPTAREMLKFCKFRAPDEHFAELGGDRVARAMQVAKCLSAVGPVLALPAKIEQVPPASREIALLVPFESESGEPGLLLRDRALSDQVLCFSAGTRAWADDSGVSGFASSELSSAQLELIGHRPHDNRRYSIAEVANLQQVLTLTAAAIGEPAVIERRLPTGEYERLELRAEDRTVLLEGQVGPEEVIPLTDDAALDSSLTPQRVERLGIPRDWLLDNLRWLADHRSELAMHVELAGRLRRELHLDS